MTTNNDPAYSIFILHNTRDRDAASKVADVMQAQCFNVIQKDEKNKKQEEEIAGSQALIVVLSNESAGGAETAAIGVAKVLGKRIYVVSSAASPTEIFQGIKVRPLSQIEGIAQDLKRNVAPLTEQEQELLAKVYEKTHENTGATVDQLALRPGELVKLTTRFNEQADRWIDSEHLLRGLFRLRKSSRLSKPSPAQIGAATLIRLQLKNIRCFASLDLEFASEKTPWTLILGDNSTGKSTLLRCLSLGLCDEQDATSLLAKMPGRLIRDGESKGEIELAVKHNDGQDYRLLTTIERDSQSSSSSEVLRKKVLSKNKFPWGKTFLCGYGAQRGIQTHSSHQTFDIRDAVMGLFDPAASLMNPEVVLLRQDDPTREGLETKLLDVLMLDHDEDRVAAGPQGVELEGPWGALPLDSLSDGYQTTTKWLLDFLGWAILAKRFSPQTPYPGGLLLVDELEQHLHPRWQRYIPSRLQRQFPTTQIIATSHTPLIAASVADLEGGQLVRLHRNGDNEVVKEVIDPVRLQGYRADQILTMEAFGLLSSRSPSSQSNIAKYQELESLEEPSLEQERERDELRKKITASLQFGETEYEREVEVAVAETLEKRLQKPPSDSLRLEIKRQLGDLFNGGKME